MIGSLIWFIIVAITVANIVGKSRNAHKRQSQRRQQMNTAAVYQEPAQKEEPRKPNACQTPVQNTVQRTQQRAVTDADRARLEAYRQKKAQPGAYVPSKKYTKDETPYEEPMPDVEETGLLGSVEDLMVKGYSGSLSFERDFIGEAADMLAAFTTSE